MQHAKPFKVFTTKGWEFSPQYQQFMGEQWQKTIFMGLVFLKSRLKIWQPCRKFPPKGPNVLVQCPAIVEKIKWKCFPQFVSPLDRYHAALKNLLQRLPKKAKICLLNMNSSWQKSNKEMFPSNSTSWHVNWFSATMPRGFHQKAKMFYLNVQREQKEFEDKYFSQVIAPLDT